MLIKKIFSAQYSAFFIKLSQRMSTERGIFCIKIFYLFSLIYAFNVFTSLSSRPIQNSFLPLWPVYWMQFLPLEMGVRIITLFLLLSSFLTAIKYDFVFFRIMTFTGLLMIGAYTNSFGKINHAEHLLILISFLLIFLPERLIKINSKTKDQLIKVIFSCQLIILLTYFLSGIWKVEAGVEQLFNGQIGSFHPQAMAYQIAGKLAETNEQSLLADILIKNVWLSWPLYLGSIYLEVCSIFIAFKPRLHKLWGAFLITFHIFIYLSMVIPFSHNILLVGIFFLNSPFTEDKIKFIHSWEELPFFGRLIKLINNRFMVLVKNK